MTGPAIQLIPSASQTVGPFFGFALTVDRALGCLVTGPATKGERIRVRMRVLDGKGDAVPDAVIEIYQANSAGAYSTPHASTAGEFCGFGRLGTDDTGTCAFDTIRPGRVADGSGGLQAPHINVCLFARGLLRHVHTRLYFDGDAANAADPLLSLVPAERRPTLLASPAPDEPGVWTFDLRLQGEQETVFFEM